MRLWTVLEALSSTRPRTGFTRRKHYWNFFWRSAGDMKHHRIGFYLLLIFPLLVGLDQADASAFRVKISPRVIKPGDAFFVKVNGVKGRRKPSAVFSGKGLPLENCGKGCFIAVGAAEIGKRPGSFTVKVRKGRSKGTVKLRVKDFVFPETNLTLPDEQVLLNNEQLAVVNEEKEKLLSLFGNISRRQWNGGFILPLKNDISTRFGTKRIMNEEWVSVHHGVDIVGEEGEEVLASNCGSVVLAEDLFFGGNTVIIDHGQGIYTIYMHLSDFNVGVEEVVSKGDVIGFVGSSGRSLGPHLHFGVKVLNVSVDPLSLIKLKL
ncbi:MAG: M23 family metallopeptidase [Nitrospirota bacterium]